MVVGPYDWDGSQINEAQQRKLIRRSIIDQLSYDPNTGISGVLPGDQPTLLAWGNDPVVPAELDGAQVRREANVLYEVPLPFTIHGSTAFTGDLLRSNALDVSANFFSKDPWNISFGIGEVTMAYQPLPFEGTLTPEQVVLAMGFGGDIGSLGGRPPGARRAGALRPPGRRLQSGPGRAARRSRCATCGPASGSSSRTWPAARSTSSRTPPAGSTRPPARSRSSSSTSARTASGFQFQVAIAGTVK